jgi:hypothetical protein
MGRMTKGLKQTLDIVQTICVHILNVTGTSTASGVHHAVGASMGLASPIPRESRVTPSWFALGGTTSLPDSLCMANISKLAETRECNGKGGGGGFLLLTGATVQSGHLPGAREGDDGFDVGARGDYSSDGPSVGLIESCGDVEATSMDEGSAAGLDSEGCCRAKGKANPQWLAGLLRILLLGAPSWRWVDGEVEVLR